MPTPNDGTRSSGTVREQYRDRSSLPRINGTSAIHQTPSPLHRTRSSPFVESGASSVPFTRKRTRSIYNSDSILAPSTSNQWPRKNSYSESPLPFVNTRYELAGGMDSQEDEYDYNYALGTRDSNQKRSRQNDAYGASYNLPNIPSDANGRLRSPNRPKGESGVVLSAINAIWQFCTIPFRGFQAGGGQTYPTTHQAKVEEFQDEKTYDHYLQSQITNSVPGRFPEEDFDENHFARPSQTPPRPLKRRHIGSESGGEKWVMVHDAASKTPQRSSHKKSSIPRPVRSSLPRRSFITSHASAVSFTGSPALPASFAAPRSPPSKFREPTAPSPASMEAMKWAAKKRKEDQDADESISIINSRLRAMIREGQEALGTRFEVKYGSDDEMEDEGFVSETKGW